MKCLLIGFGTLLVLAISTTDSMAQKGRGLGRGVGGGQGHGSGNGSVHVGSSAGLGKITSGTQSQGRNQGAVFLSGNQNASFPNGVSNNAGGQELLRMREEEKLARDVYTVLAKSSGLAMFRNIARAENQHMQSLERLIQLSGTNAVMGNDTAGAFAFSEYQQLYTTLIAKGSRSPLDALMVGAKIEEMDIADLRRLSAQTTSPQVRQVLSHLLQGSQNHLRAFAAQITRQGAVYKAEFLSQADFNQIANSSVQGQGQQGIGRGTLNRGQGQGRGRNAGGGGSRKGRGR